MKKKSINNLLVTLLVDTIPTHFNLAGKADGWGPKSTLVGTSIFLSLLSIGLYALMTNITKLDPKKSAGQNPVLMQKMGLAVVALLSLVQLIIVQSSLGQGQFFDHLIIPGVGLLFAVMGNYMHSLKPNYFAGMRLPWTLEDPENWRLTHQLASKYWVGGGLLVAALGLFLPLKWGLVVLLVSSFILVLVPAIFSYRLFQQKKKQNG
ncbi:MAG: DUF1648 domain-containing protein [Sphingobacteriia bacterium]|nr:MAG: DUF1648 domain-containing protein [Sphingobacteriia bacterium]